MADIKHPWRDRPRVIRALSEDEWKDMHRMNDESIRRFVNESEEIWGWFYSNPKLYDPPLPFYNNKSQPGVKPFVVEWYPPGHDFSTNVFGPDVVSDSFRINIPADMTPVDSPRLRYSGRGKLHPAYGPPNPYSSESVINAFEERHRDVERFTDRAKDEERTRKRNRRG